jgi:hypothetical protein
MRYLVILITTVLISLTAKAAPDLSFYKSHAVRVEVRGSTPSAVASSGFLWEQNDWVVTSLHAIPLDGNILVKCGNDVR